MEYPPEDDQAQQFAASQSRFLERPQVKIVRPSNRRKFLVGALGGAALLGLGAASVAQAIQSLRVARNTKAFPFDNYKNALSLTYSADLSLGAFYDWEEHSNPQAQLLIWSYQQQNMITLPTGPVTNPASWSLDNRYLLLQRKITDVTTVLDVWDIQAHQRLGSYQDGDGSSAVDGAVWSPDSTRIALLMQDRVVILSAPQMQPLFTLHIPASGSVLAWSPAGDKLALALDQNATSGSLQIWNLQTRQAEVSLPFSGQGDSMQSVLVWSPDGKRIAAILYGQCRIIHVTELRSDVLSGEACRSGVLAWSPDSRYLALAVELLPPSFRSEFCVWDIARRVKARTIINNGSSGPDEIAWSKDGQFIVSIIGLYTQVSWPWP